MTKDVVTIKTREAWDGLMPPAAPLPLQQSWAYGEALAAQGATVSRRLVRAQGAPVALAQVTERRVWRVLHLATVMRGPLWIGDDLDAEGKAAAIRSLSHPYNKWRRRVLIHLPDDDGSSAAASPYRIAGLRPVMTGFSTAWLDLAAAPEALRAGLKGKWRNALATAEKAGLDVVASGRRPSHYSWLLDQEEAQRGTAGYLAPPVGLVDLFAAASAAPQPVLVMTARRGRDRLAGQLFLLHGSSATYHIGWSGDDGRAVSAHNLLMWRAMLALKELGVRWLDLGGMDTGPRAGIARFKLGTGARPVTFSGAWA